MRRRLREAWNLQKTGIAEYELAGPESANRAEHRRKALDALKGARDIYLAAKEEDPQSRGIEDRIHEVTRMIAELRKDSAIGER